MRNFINIVGGEKTSLFEEKTTKTKTDTKGSYDFLHSLETGGKEISTREKKKTIAPKTTDLKSAGGQKTKQKATGVRMNHPGAGEAFRSMMAHGGEDVISDDEAATNATVDAPTRIGNKTNLIGDAKVTNENLPAIVNHEIAEAGYEAQPEWHQVKHLPGYMINAIRAGGRKVFAEYTDTPLEDIQMICTFMNPEQDVKNVMNWVKANGELADTARMTFGGGIDSDVLKYVTPDMTFLLVSDFMGKYVYAWASDERIESPEPLKISHQR